MVNIQFVGPESEDYRRLAGMLDAYYYTLVGPIQDRYAEPNRPENMSGLAVVYENQTPIAIGAWKGLDGQTAEIKRIFVLPSHRRRGVATRLIPALEAHASGAGKRKFILETAKTTDASHKLYLSLGYRMADYYGSPAGEDNCLCFVKGEA